MRQVLLVLMLLIWVGWGFALTGFAESELFDLPEQTLPVELSSFSAVVTAQNFVRLNWTSESETNLAGYYVYRSEVDELSTALLVSPLIPATNGSVQHSYTFQDAEVILHSQYCYWLQSMEYDGGMDYHGPIRILVNPGGDPDAPPVVFHTGLHSIFPNPFNPVANLAYGLAEPATVKLTIYNVKGQSVRAYSQTHAVAGNYILVFEGRDDRGKSLSSGVYYVVMQVGKEKFMRKMALLK